MGFASGGVVTVQIQSGANSYSGSTRNGLTSKDYGPWQGSFSFVGAPPSTFTTLPQGGIHWSSTAKDLRGRNGQRYAYHCPPGGSFGSIWGSDLYTDDSSVCTAAVHAGVLSQVHGGSVVIEIRPGSSAYRGSARNGVSTANYGNWGGSYVVIGAQ
ncbi:MAG: hypothetical protein HZB71_05320 [Betaproteobacteria bacterium]|nr:hypothetical protein [Betaproteobacteria bacterium]